MIPKISIIVPVYNAEKYLPSCVDSILAQTFTEFELLLIDDGSQDCSGSICDEYGVKDRRVRVFHQKNQGVSAARNLGLDNAQGKWITFVDSDDLLISNFCEILNDNKSEDLIICSFKMFGRFEKKYVLKDGCLSKKAFSYVINDYLANIHFTTTWGKFFKKSILESSKLRFNPNINSTEDTLFVYEYLLHVKSIMIKSDILYLYRQVAGGLSCQDLSVDSAIDTIKSVSYIVASLEKEYGANLSSHLYNLVNYIYIRSIRFIQNNYYSLLQRRSLIEKLHSQLPLYFREEYLPQSMGLRGKVFYFLTRKRSYFMASIFSYCLSM